MLAGLSSEGYLPEGGVGLHSVKPVRPREMCARARKIKSGRSSIAELSRDVYPEDLCPGLGDRERLGLRFERLEQNVDGAFLLANPQVQLRARMNRSQLLPRRVAFHTHQSGVQGTSLRQRRSISLSSLAFSEGCAALHCPLAGPWG